MTEKDLRRLLRESAAKAAAYPLTWVEPGLGGSFGAPDVLVPYGALLFPLELKIGSRTRTGTFNLHLRPAQISWHRRMASSGIMSAVLAAFETTERLERFKMFPGGSLGKEVRPSAAIDLPGRDLLMDVLAGIKTLSLSA